MPDRQTIRRIEQFSRQFRIDARLLRFGDEPRTRLIYYSGARAVLDLLAGIPARGTQTADPIDALLSVNDALHAFARSFTERHL